MFPPFYTDFGKNITIGKDVFINSGCHFQDQGGIEIGDGTLIGHNVVLATINHDLNPKENRKNHYAPIKIGTHVWIGSNATILPGDVRKDEEDFDTMRNLGQNMVYLLNALEERRSGK